jgi:hypothetical protein
VSKLLGGVGRGVRGEEGEEGGLRGVEAVGTNVSPSPRASSPISVAPVSGSRGAPQVEQNLPLGETCAPHFEQNMGGRNSITGSRGIVNEREMDQEMRSTWTAVPYASTSVTPCITSVAS